MNSDIASLAHALLPEISLVLGALVVLAVDLGWGGKSTSEQRLRTSVVLASFAVLAAMYHSFAVGPVGSVFGGAFVVDRLAVASRIGVLVLTQLMLLSASGTSRLRNPAEYVAIVLFASTGLTLMCSAQQLLVGFLSLELASLSLYVLAGFDKKRRDSAEAALKYFLLGAMSAAFLLFGFSLIYGLTGSISLPVIARQLSGMALNPMLFVGLVMVLVAFGFKAAAAPFHLWAPDVYQGAPAPSAALIASASKLAGFTFFLRLLWGGFSAAGGDASGATVEPGWIPVVAIISLASLLIGNLGALAQSNVRRLLAYSAIAHAGTLMLGLVAAREAGAAPLFYYAATYGIATVGAFGVIGAIQRAGGCDAISDLAGLHRRSPLLAVCLFVFVLSLAGIPPLAGFFGKFGVFVAALKLNGLGGYIGWLSLLAILLSAVALYYYLVVLKQALVAKPARGAEPIKVSLESRVGLVLAALLLVGLGVWPSAILQWISIQ